MKRKLVSQNIGLYVLTVIYFLLMSILFTRPLFRKITTHTVGAYGDNFYFLWQIEWIKRAIFDLKVMPLTTHLLNFPYGYSLLTSEIAPLQILIALPFALIDETVLGYNISMLFSFILAGIFMFAWVYELTKSWWAGITAGSAYTFLPYHIAHFLVGHLNIAGIQWIPLYFWGLTAILTGSKRSWKHILLLAVGISGIVLTSLYYTYMTLIISGIILVIYFLFFARDKFLKKEIWIQLLFGVLISSPFLAVGIGPYIYVHINRGTSRELAQAMAFSASITDFLLPFTKQVLFGKWVWRNFPRDLWNEATLYLGLPATVLSMIWFWKKNANKNAHLSSLFLVGGFSAFILAMGINITWKELPVLINIPEWLGGIMNTEESLIYLPGMIFYKYFPFYSLMRVPMRYGIFTMLFNCAAAGMGVCWLLSKLKGNLKNLAGNGLLFLVILDFFNTPFALIEIKPRELDLWLAEQPEGGLIYLPFEQSIYGENIYYTVHNNKPLLGASRDFPSDRFLHLGGVLHDFPSQSSVDILLNEHITYVVVDENEIPITEPQFDNVAKLGLEFEGSFSGYSVFTILN